MQLKIVTVLAFLLLFAPMAIAQDAITDDDLKRYAISMDSIENMKAGFIQRITEMVNSNENISAARYNDLSKIISDEVKLAEAEATPEEIEFVNLVAQKKEEETAKINATFQSLAVDYIGAKTYNAIKTALKNDEAVKQRYEVILKEVQTD
ncbi:MAG: hypothetical protein HC811_02820 [Flammeovirgaceae bacterium]|nr:hypothetical protein [Flammeovirgaceae bacterium]